ncbi:hypothetical protein BJX65DRAFT_321315 [Aspergillus insuetus]
MAPLSREDFRIAIICALTREADAVETLFDEPYDKFSKRYGRDLRDTNTYINGRLGQHDVVVCYLPEVGKRSAAAAAANLRHSYHNIELALVVGICGGVPYVPPNKTEVILGDVILSDSVIEYDLGKQYPDGFRRKTDPRETLGRASVEIRGFFAGISGRNTRKSMKERVCELLGELKVQEDTPWEYPGSKMDVLFPAAQRHKHPKDDTKTSCLCFNCDNSDDPVCDKALEGDCQSIGCWGTTHIPRKRLDTKDPRPSIHIGSMACADTVLKSGEHRDRLAEKEKVIGFEMESAGVWDNFPCVIIKGVCDYADSHKNKHWQDYAAGTAACCAKAFLELWSSSSPSIDSVSNYLRQYYEIPSRLSVKRISGEVLPMSECYINLGIVEKEQWHEDIPEHRSSPFSLRSRLIIDTPKPVKLQDIFEARMGSEGSVTTPKRVVVEGRAGVGKSTLCKKIVHDYLYQGMWHQYFDLLPPDTPTLKGLFSMAQHLEQLTLYPTNKNRILFILDGLDEVSQAWSPETPMYNFLGLLLNRPRVIVTSRPYGLSLVGFTMEQVETYIRNILALVNEQNVLMTLVRIPIMLDSLCYSWSRQTMGTSKLATMTAIYSTLILKLWQKDLAQLDVTDTRKSPRTHLNAHTISGLDYQEIEKLIAPEMDLLEKLAFICNVLYQQFKGVQHEISFLHSSETTATGLDRSYHFLHLTFQEFFAARYFVRCWAHAKPLLCVTLAQGTADLSFVEPRVFLGNNKYSSRYDMMWRFVTGLFENFPEFLAGSRYVNDFFNQLNAEPLDILGPAHQRLIMHCLSEVTSNKQEVLNRPELETCLSTWTRLAAEWGVADVFAGEREFPDHILEELIQEPLHLRTKEQIIAAILGKGDISPNFVTTLLASQGVRQPPNGYALDHLSQQQLLSLALKAIFPLLQRPLLYVAPPPCFLANYLYLTKDRQKDLKETILTALCARLNVSVRYSAGLFIIMRQIGLNTTADIQNALGPETPMSPDVKKVLLSLIKSQSPVVQPLAAQLLVQKNPRSPNIPIEIICALQTGKYCLSGTIDIMFEAHGLKSEILTACLQAGDAVAEAALDAMFKHAHSALDPKLAEFLSSMVISNVVNIRRDAALLLAAQDALPLDTLNAILPQLRHEDQVTAVYTALAFLRHPTLPSECKEALYNSEIPMVQSLIGCVHRDYQADNANTWDIGPVLRKRDGLPSCILARILYQQSPVNGDAVADLLKYGHRISAARFMVGSAIHVPPPVAHEVLQYFWKHENSRTIDWTKIVGQTEVIRLFLQSPLPAATLQLLYAVIDRHDLWKYDDDVVRLLANQPHLPESVFDDLISHLCSAKEWERQSQWAVDADRILRRLRKLDHDLPDFIWVRLYRFWLDRSFFEQFSCYFVEGALVLNTPQGTTKVVFESKKRLRLVKHEIRKAQVSLGIPGATVLRESAGDAVKVLLRSGYF